MIYFIKRFSEGDSQENKKPSSLKTIGKVGLSIGAGAGLASGGHHLLQSWNVKKLREGVTSNLTQSQAMKAVNDMSKTMGFMDIEKQRLSELKSISKTSLPVGQIQRQVCDTNRISGALKNSKLKRIMGKTALVAGGLGALAYGASKLNKNKNKD